MDLKYSILDLPEAQFPKMVPPLEVHSFDVKQVPIMPTKGAVSGHWLKDNRKKYHIGTVEIRKKSKWLKTLLFYVRPSDF